MEHFCFGGGPLVGVALAGGDQAGYGSAGDGARRLDEHLQVEAVGKAPLNLTHRVTREGEHGFCLRYRDSGHNFVLKLRSYCALTGMTWHVTHITSRAVDLRKDCMEKARKGGSRIYAGCARALRGKGLPL